MAGAELPLPVVYSGFLQRIVELRPHVRIGQIGVLPGGMKPEELLVQLVAGPGDGNGFTDTPDVVDMARTEESTADRLVYACAYSPSRSGPHVYGVRVLPVTPGLASPLETRLVLWG